MIRVNGTDDAFLAESVEELLQRRDIETVSYTHLDVYKRQAQ